MMPLLPLFWIGGLTMALEVLQAGGTLLYPESPALDTVCDSIVRLRANRINTWGPQLARLRTAVAARGIDVESIGGLAQLREPDGKPIESDPRAVPPAITSGASSIQSPGKCSPPAARASCSCGAAG
jgi:hypothetical protein